MLLLAVAISLLVLGSVPIAHYARKARPRPSVPTVDPPAQHFDLVLSEAIFAGQGPSRHIAGSIRNTSKVPYTDAEVEFVVRDQANVLLGKVTASVATVGPEASAPFQTGPVPEGSLRLALNDISGTRVEPPPR